MKFNETFEVTEKGVIRPTYASAARKEAGKYLESLGFTRTPNGAYVMHVADGTDGNPVYLKLNMAITNKNVMAPKAETVKEVVEPELTLAE